MKSITLNLNDKQCDALRASLKGGTWRTDLPYTKWQCRLSDVIITAYTSGKTVFSGASAAQYAQPWQPQTSDTYPQAGSDEVGTGDYFGPVCVACVLLDHVPDVLIRDSKQMTDEIIRKIAPTLMQQCVYSLLVVDNPTYNRIHEQHNLNTIKALLHNQAWLHLAKKTTIWPPLCVVDQFMPEPSYYRALKNEPKIARGLTFTTKAENKYPAVAAASVIARYAFLRAMDQLEAHYQMVLPKGSGSNVDSAATSFVKAYGTQALGQIAKLHFKNTEKVLNAVHE